MDGAEGEGGRGIELQYEVSELARAAIRAGGRILGLNDQGVADAVIRRYFRALPAPGRRHMVDVGAAYGSVAQLFLEDGWTADLLEPDPACLRILDRLAVAYGGRVRIFPYAAASEDLEAANFRQNSIPGLSGLAASPFGSTVADLRVRAVRLDGFLRSQNVARVDLLKIDTEGSDFAVLEAHDFAGLPPALVFVEFSYYFPGQDESLLRRSISAMGDRGYSPIIFEYDDDGNFRRGNWNHRLVAIHAGGSGFPTRKEAFGNILFFRCEDRRLPETLAATIRALG